MKTRVTFISVIIFICSFLISCNTNTTSSIPLIRTYSEYNDLSEEDKLNVISSFDKISSEELEEELLKITKEYLLKNELDNFKIKTIDLAKDNLLLASGKNRKIRCNGILYMEFLLSENNDKIDEKTAKKFLQVFFEFLYSDLLVSSQIMSIELFVFEDEENVLVSYGGGVTDIAFEPYINQDETEYLAQTLAYNWGQDEIYLTLRKFGHINNNELYIEYAIDDEYFSQNDESDLKNMCIDLTTLLLSKDDFINFIEEYDTTKIILSFTNYSVLAGNNVVYTLEL